MLGREKKTTDTGSHAVKPDEMRNLSVSDESAANETAAKPKPAQTQERPKRPGAKNRPTPKRKDAQAARRKPLVPADREAAKREAKERAREANRARRAAADRGDDSALPLRDRGPQRRFIRNWVDSRWTMGEIAMPLMLIMVLTLLIPNYRIQTFTTLFVWVIVLCCFIDCFLMWRKIKKALQAKFGTVEPGGARYAVMRSMQMRRTRYPRPTVNRGDKVS